MKKRGTVIYLNGVTSTGKTTLTNKIQELSEENCYSFCNDHFQNIVSRKFLNKNYIRYLIEAIVVMYHSAVSASKLGIDSVIDGMVTEYPAFQEVFRKSHYDIINEIFGDELMMVEVYCPLEECRRRNIARGDRGENQSQWQYDMMNRDVVHDFKVDTFADDSDTCARQIIDKLKSRAF